VDWFWTLILYFVVLILHFVVRSEVLIDMDDAARKYVIRFVVWLLK